MSDEIIKGVHNYTDEEKYIYPEDPLVREKLEWFKDQKLGLMMHWGPYSQLGIVESWALSDEDGDWSRTDIDWTEDMELFKKQYINLNKTFNPIRFMPDEWAKLAKDSGFKYLIFTTKHHDGFCMWDTKTTDYKITGEDSPFKDNENSDILAKTFSAFQKEGIGIAAYFSKADWNSNYYWAEGHKYSDFKNRNTSYDTKEHPELWNKFVEFTHKQLKELLNNYGKIDVLWLDAGWVCQKNNQDLRLHEVVEEVRNTSQPGLIVADRTVGGIYENYITPEQTIPEDPIDVPWESCITLGSSFSFAYGDDYKSPRTIVHLLIDIVSKGGNLALNIGPQPDGRLPDKAINSIKGLGEWLQIYGDAIYGTRPCAPYRIDKMAFTKKGNKTYLFYLYDNDDELLDELVLTLDFKVKQITLMNTKELLDFTEKENELKIVLPKRNCETPLCDVFILE